MRSTASAAVSPPAALARSRWTTALPKRMWITNTAGSPVTAAPERSWRIWIMPSRQAVIVTAPIPSLPAPIERILKNARFCEDRRRDCRPDRLDRLLDGGAHLRHPGRYGRIPHRRRTAAIDGGGADLQGDRKLQSVRDRLSPRIA